MKYTGERLVPGKRGLELLELEHRGRYELAALICGGKAVLDVGCGAGYGTALLAHHARTVVGVDVAADAIAFAVQNFQRKNVQFEVLDVTSPEAGERLQVLSPAGFDVVVCFELIEHLSAPVSLLDLTKRNLRPGGCFIVSTPNAARPHRFTERDNPYHVVEYDEESLSSLLQGRFRHVQVLSQTVHLATGIQGGGLPDRLETWPKDQPSTAKYFIAVCSDRKLDAVVDKGLLLLASDQHLTLLQSLLAEFRQAQAGRAEVDERLQGLLDQATEDTRRQQGRVVELTQKIEERTAAEKELQRQIGRHEGRFRELDRRAEERKVRIEALTREIEERAAAADELERRVELQADRICELTRQIEERTAAASEFERRIELQADRIRQLTRQIQERTAAGEELDRLLEIERLRLAERQQEIETLRSALEAAKEKEERFLRLSAVTGEEQGGYPEFFARLAANLDRTIGVLELEKEYLEEKVVQDQWGERRRRGDRETLMPPVGRVSRATSAAEEASKDELIYGLARELYQVLTSKRWRLAMTAVRLKNRFTGRAEGSPLGAHLYSHFKRAGISVPAELRLSGRGGPGASYRDLVLHPPTSGVGLVALSDQERHRWRRQLERRAASELVTVVMPTWDRAHMLRDAVGSVVRQSYHNWELIVVDDGSEDDTRSVVTSLVEQEPRIRYHRIEHQGVAAARDVGLAEARGEIIAYLDSDNTWDSDYLLFTVHAIRDSGLACSYAILKIVDHDHGKSISFRNRAFDSRTLLKNNYIDINVFAHRVELAGELGGFDHTLRRWVDWDLILRYTRRHRPAQIPIVLCDYQRGKKLKQITTEEPRVFKFKVLNQHLIDWRRQELSLHRRTRGHVTVVVLNYRRADLTEKCVSSLFETESGRSFDVVVVDNSATKSERHALSQLASRFPNVEVLENYENYGFALGNNLGASVATGEFVVWLNNDTEVEPGWLEPLIEPLEADPDVGITGPKLLYPDRTVQHAGLVFSHRSKIPFHRHKGAPSTAPYVNVRRRFQALTGACLAIRVADFVALRGFDPLYLNGCEDLDLCFRMRTELGKEVLYVPESTVIHHEGKSPKRGQHIAANRRRFVEQWGGQVAPDDQQILAEDGFVVADYTKPGKEPDGQTALYVPTLESAGEITSVDSKGSPYPTAGTRAGDALTTINVGLVSMWYERGVSYVAKQLADGLEAAGRFRTHVLARWESERFQNRGSIFHPRVLNGGDDPSAAETVAWARHNDLDLVIFVEVHPNDWKRVEALQRDRVPVLAYEHLDVLRLETLDRYETLDGLLSSTFYGWRVFKERFPGTPCLLVPWGIPPERARRHLGDRGSARSGEGGIVRFVHVAGWAGVGNRKNTDLVLRAFHQTSLQHGRLRLHVQAPIERYGEDCADIVRRDRRIELEQGTVDDIFQAYSNADVLLSPSKREGLGLPVLEALACGVPSIISRGFTMLEWPVAGDHAVVCPAVPTQEQEQVPRYLPLLDVEESDLIDAIQEMGASRSRLREMKRNVERDRHFWLWTWQPRSFALQLERFLAVPGESIGDERGFLPGHVIEFERRRAASRESGSNDPSDQLSSTSVTETRRAPPVIAGETCDSGVNYLFIAGCQRSGTTALLHLLNEDPRVVLGRERYKYCRTEITPEHFTEERFFSPRENETNYRVEEFYERLHERWRSGSVRYIGDKVPFYYKDLFYLAETFPGCKILFLLRDLERVASSYNARAWDPDDYVWRPTMDYRKAVEDWNESLGNVVDFIEAGHGNKVCVIRYEQFFSGDERYVDSLYGFLQVPLVDEVRHAFHELTREWPERESRPSNLTREMREHLAEHRDRALEARCLAQCPVVLSSKSSTAISGTV